MDSSISLFFLLLQLTMLSATKKTYIVHMKQRHDSSVHPTQRDWYAATLDSSPDSLLYAYTASYNGFAAILDPQEAHVLRASDSVLGVYEDTRYTLHTTRTPEFLGLQAHSAFWQDLHQASLDVVIGVLDTGVWPESQSFDDSQMPQIPTRWRGNCESAPDFDPSLCNNKLIGARSFSKGYRMASANARKNREPASPRDLDGHGTHTASTAAGSAVSNATLLGYATGTARGMAPQARVAAYKVCWTGGCFASDILAGMDQAIQDGVDVLSLSLGGSSSSVPYYFDNIAIGAFAALERGIFVACSAGNTGPRSGSVANVAPWIMTVGAGTLDRDFPAYATLGNGKRFAGVSLYSGEGMGDEPVGLVYFSDRSNSSGSICMPGSLDPDSVRGKVVVCDRGLNSRVEKGAVVRDAGGVGMILANTAASGEGLVADSHLVAAVAVGESAGDEIREYASLDPNPTAVLSFGGTVLNVRPSPVVAAFSSRGPNGVTAQILKPDVIGPGVNILAGWSGAVGPSGSQDTRKTGFNIMSGTSMSCPHISGLAALLKAAHPDWSPSAIKSALMTTAYTYDNTESPLRDATGEESLSTPWAYGAGHVNPQKALSPGLLYDASTQDYIYFLCSLNYTLDHLRLLVKHPDANCSKKFADPGDLNYPSFSVVFGSNKVVRYTRTLTNVGEPGSAYNVAVSAPSTVDITVNPNKLEFGEVGERQTYTVTFVSNRSVNDSATSGFGSIMWSNEQHLVRSPVAFTWTYF
ncbi:subtilisin-like protease SBT1.8 [Glycine soja]|uniref:Subtilisin-like protease SBT1.8 n=1 Tax=Glycine soja TaxID=3848 RepID=A0A445HEC3_GLYSO|nr:subtilisin-like protease SBT1.8 [Glycine soja]RZB71939.1 Subtilisin-like protease SBT1.8 [Glycine soja]